MDNPGFVRENSSLSITDSQHDVIQAEINITTATADVVVPLTNCRSRFSQFWNNYQWHMRDYFYIHLIIFFLNTLLCGIIIWIIEERKIPFIDCWFISSTCVFTCGLETYEFASFHRASQVLLLIFTLISGITVSTIPAIIIKIYRAKRERNSSEDRNLRWHHSNSYDTILNKHLESLPDPQKLRIRAHMILIILILSICFLIYLVSFMSIGFWLKYHYNLLDYYDTNKTINPFYASFVISVTGFNQNGLSVWRKGISVFVDDVFMNIIVMIIVMSGTSLFPAILRGVVNLLKYLVPWEYKIFFDYILLNNHRLSTVIFPSIQTRLYVTITILMQILGVTVALILDYNNPYLAVYNGGQRFMIFMFQTVNTRFGGYASIPLEQLAAGTLIIFVLLMCIKPQMLCTINETPFEMEWILLQTEEQPENGVPKHNRRPSIEMFLPVNRMKDYLLRQGSLTKAQAKIYFARILRTDQTEAALQQLNEKRHQHRLSNVSSTSTNSIVHISLLRMKLHLIIFCRHAILDLFSLLISTRTWLFIFIFLICVFEAPLTKPSHPTITVFRIVFEVISAFGGCGFSLGYAAISTGLSAMFSVSSKIILILTMCMGRHRGLLDSMKDQEEIEYSAQTLIDSWRRLALYEQQQRERMKVKQQISTISIQINPPTPPRSTRF